MPILSLIIPTHERFRYAEETVKTILAMEIDVELVVCDTSAIYNWSAFAQCPKLKIIRPDVGISVVDNFNIALTHASGEYVCFIGDDDLVAKNIVDIALRASQLNVDAVRFTFPIDFYWQDYLHRNNPEAYSGTIWIGKYTGHVRELDAHNSLREAAAKLGHGVFDMPRAYCGLVSRELVMRIISEQDLLFGGVSPDIYSAALIAAYARRTIEIDYPAVILGASGASTAGQSAAGNHVGNLRDNAHIQPFINLIWHPLVPEFYSVSTVWSYSLVRALERITIVPSVRPHWGRLYAQCIIYHPKYWRFTLSAMRNFIQEKSVFALLCSLVDGVFRESAWAIGRIYRRFSVRYQMTNKLRVPDITSSAAASAIAEKAISDSPKLSWLYK